MASALSKYELAVSQQELAFSRQLRSGTGNATVLAASRQACELMRNQLRDNPSSILYYDRLATSTQDGPQLWVLKTLKKAFDDLFPQLANEQSIRLYRKLEEDCRSFRDRRLAIADYRQKIYGGSKPNTEILAHEDYDFTNKVTFAIAKAFMIWFQSRRFYEGDLRKDADSLYLEFSKANPSERVLWALMLKAPYIIEATWTVPRALAADMLELGIGLIPVVGNAAALYEAFRGVDLSGFDLSTGERALLAATVLLPLVGRLLVRGARGYKAVKTAQRLVSLYGEDAVAWSRIMQLEGRISSSVGAQHILAGLEKSIANLQHVDADAGKGGLEAIKTLLQGPSVLIETEAKALEDLLRDLVENFPIFQGLDVLAVQRAVEKKTIDHIKGQLLEELIESRVVPMLSERHGAGLLALGIKTEGRQLEYIPGHLVADLEGNALLTDGIIVARRGETLEIVAVFEAKAGGSSSKGLSATKGKGIAAMTGSEVKEFELAVRDSFLDQRARAKREGRVFNKTLAQVRKEFVQSEWGGQVRRDIERLASNVDPDPIAIRIGDETFTISISPTKTKFFGVVPKNVNPESIEKALKDYGYLFETIGVDITAEDLQAAGKRLANAVGVDR